MTDEEYIFMQEIREKKAIGRGAYHKKSGSKSKYCSLPSDHLTNAEKKRRNGEVKTYNINRCIKNYDEFKSMPLDLQESYLFACRKAFSARLPAVANSMGISQITLQKYCVRKGIHVGKGGQYKLKSNWWKFINGEIDINGKELIEAKIEEPKVEVESIPAIDWAEPEKPIKITDDDIPLGASIAAIIEALKGSGAKLTIELTL